MDRPSISQLKSELSAMGLSTQTPGLVGDERFEELNGRLLDAQSKLDRSLASSEQANDSTEGAEAINGIQKLQKEG